MSNTPSTSNPVHGTFLREECRGFDKWFVYADGLGGNYAELAEANCVVCGYIAPGPSGPAIQDESKGQKVTAHDWNLVSDKVNKIFADEFPNSAPTEDWQRRNDQSYGWGQTGVDLVVKGQKFTAEVANKVIDRVKIAAEQTGSQYTLNNVVKGQKISALSINQIAQVLNDVEPKRYIAAQDQLALLLLGSTSMTAPWTSSITFNQNLSFGNYDAARHYFNSGSSVKITLSISGGNNNSNALAGLYEKMGTLNISWKNTVSSTPNLISEGKGFEHLNSNTWTKLFSVTGSGTGYGYGYGYGYGTTPASSPTGYGYGYGYGYGGTGTGSIIVYGKIDGGNVMLKVTVDSKSTTEKTGTHTLYTSLQKAINKTSNSAHFSINEPGFSGIVS